MLVAVIFDEGHGKELAEHAAAVDLYRHFLRPPLSFAWNRPLSIDVERALRHCVCTWAGIDFSYPRLLYQRLFQSILPGSTTQYQLLSPIECLVFTISTPYERNPYGRIGLSDTPPRQVGDDDRIAQNK